MNIIDIIVLVVLLPMMIRGISKGFISQAVAFAALFLGTYTAYLITLKTGSDLADVLNLSPKAGNIIVFAIAFIAIWGILAVVGQVLKNIFKMLLLEWLDKLLGGVFALATTFLVCGLFVIMFDALNDTALLVDQEYLDGSFFYHRLETVTRGVFPYLHDIIPAAKAGFGEAADGLVTLIP